VGLIGGGITAGVALQAIVVLLHNCSETYAKFPNVPRPWLAVDLDLPLWVLLPLGVLGCVVPYAMGLVNVWLVRPRDAWADLSAGITAGLAGTLAAYAAGIGWAALLALTIVPSISDLTLLGNAARLPPAEESQSAKHPSEVLVERYPELGAVAANERGPRFFPKIVADEVIGTGYGVWLGLFISLGSCGILGCASTQAAGYLVRRGGSVWAIGLPYLELTVSSSVLGLVLLHQVLAGMSEGLGPMLARSVPLLWLGWLTAAVFLAVVQRWGWKGRLGMAIIWLALLGHVSGPAMPWYAAAAFYALGVGLVGCSWWYRGRVSTVPMPA
jgi:hypothetical protein